MAVFKGNVTIGTFIERGAKVEQVNNTITQDASTDQSQHPTQVNNNLVVQESLISELLPIFMNNREAAAEFLQDIREAKPTDITKRVKLLVKEGTISEEMSHKDLYDILFKYHYYDRTLQNWNSQL